MVIMEIKGTTASMRIMLIKDARERSLTKIKRIDAFDPLTFRHQSMNGFFKMVAEQTERRIKRGRIRKLVPDVMGEVTADST